MRHHWQLIFSRDRKCRVLSLDGGRGGGGTACGVGLPVHVDEVRSGGVDNKVQKSEHLALHKTFVFSQSKNRCLTPAAMLASTQYWYSSYSQSTNPTRMETNAVK